MSAERALKEEGEELAKAAVENDIGSTPLRRLYEIAKSRSLVFLEAYVQQQIPRIKGYPSFGPRVLDVLRRHGDNKREVIAVLKYANMLYDYHRLKPIIELQPKVEKVVKDKTRPYLFRGVEIGQKREFFEVKVYLGNFRGDPRSYSREIAEHIRRVIPEMSGISFRVWIERR